VLRGDLAQKCLRHWQRYSRDAPFWQILYDQGANVIVSGHAYRYESSDRMKPNPEKCGIPDSVSASSSSGPDVDDFVVLR
jgi:hypothetical protein